MSTDSTLLRQVAERLINCFGNVDHVARIGTEQFAVVIPEVDDEAAVGRAFDDWWRQSRRARRECQRIASPQNYGYPSRGLSRRGAVTVPAEGTVTRASIREYLTTQRKRYGVLSRGERQALLERSPLGRVGAAALALMLAAAAWGLATLHAQAPASRPLVSDVIIRGNRNSIDEAMLSRSPWAMPFSRR